MDKGDIKRMKFRIERIKKELGKLGEIHPGTVSKQYNVCGTPNCVCKDPKNPKKHGPYWQLSYVWRGGHTTRFIREERLQEMQEKVKNHKTFRRLTQEWIDLSIEIEKILREKEKKEKNGLRS
jgi:hypothetical protein